VVEPELLKSSIIKYKNSAGVNTAPAEQSGDSRPQLHLQYALEFLANRGASPMKPSSMSNIIHSNITM
jgi:hypothetical protein